MSNIMDGLTYLQYSPSKLPDTISSGRHMNELADMLSRDRCASIGREQEAEVPRPLSVDTYNSYTLSPGSTYEGSYFPPTPGPSETDCYPQILPDIDNTFTTLDHSQIAHCSFTDDLSQINQLPATLDQKTISLSQYQYPDIIPLPVKNSYGYGSCTGSNPEQNQETSCPVSAEELDQLAAYISQNNVWASQFLESRQSPETTSTPLDYINDDVAGNVFFAHQDVLTAKVKVKVEAPEIVYDWTPSQTATEIMPRRRPLLNDAERRYRRKMSNRRAAAKCRIRKRHEAMKLGEAFKLLEEDNKKLRDRVTELDLHRKQLEASLTSHRHHGCSV